VTCQLHVRNLLTIRQDTAVKKGPNASPQGFEGIGDSEAGCSSALAEADQGCGEMGMSVAKIAIAVQQLWAEVGRGAGDIRQGSETGVSFPLLPKNAGYPGSGCSSTYVKDTYLFLSNSCPQQQADHVGNTLSGDTCKHSLRGVGVK
jgi:hypothetical protein